jgi:hypothetical protein
MKQFLAKQPKLNVPMNFRDRKKLEPLTELEPSGMPWNPQSKRRINLRVQAKILSPRTACLCDRFASSPNAYSFPRATGASRAAWMRR